MRAVDLDKVLEAGYKGCNGRKQTKDSLNGESVENGGITLLDTKTAIGTLKEIEEELTAALVGLPRDNVMVSIYNRRIDAIDTAIQALEGVDRFEK